MWSRRWARLCVAVASFALTALIASPAAAQPVIDDEFYTVVKGDTCVSVSAKVWPGDPEKVNTLHALNPEVGKAPEPHKLRPGMRLRIRADNPDARLTFIRPKVNAKRRGKPDWGAAPQGMGLYRLDSVNTLDGAAAELRFRDTSELQLDANALIVIYGINKSAAIKLRTPKSGSVELVHGDMRLRLKELRGEAPKIQTPSAEVAVVPGSRDLAVGVDKNKVARVSVFDGSAEIAGKGKARKDAVKVAKGFGTRIEPGKPPEPPQPLPAAPPWVNGGARDVYVSLGNEGAPVEVAWKPVDSAVRYRAQLARDPVMNDTLIDAARTSAGELRASQAAVPPGRYHARVSGYNAAGLLGMPSLVRTIDVVQLTAGPTRRAGQGLIGVGELGLILGDVADLEVTVDGKPVARSRSFLVRGVGRHVVKIAPKNDAGRAAEIPVEIVAPRAQLEVAPERGGLVATVRLVDDKGAPVAVSEAPELALTGLEGTRVSGFTRDGLVWRARVEPALGRTARRAQVVAEWAKVEIGRAEHSEKIAVEPRVIPYRQRVAVVSPIGQSDLALDVPAMVSLGIPDGFVFAVRVQPELVTEDERDRENNVALSTEVPLGERFAIYGTLAGRDVGQLPLTVGLRAGLVGSGRQRPSLFAAPRALRGWLGVAVDGTLSSLAGSPVLHGRASLLFRTSGSSLSLDVAAALIAGDADRGSDGVAIQLAVTPAYVLSPRLAVVVGAESYHDGNTNEGTFGGGFRFRLSPFELQLAVRTGLGENSLWGRVVGVVSLEYRTGSRF